MQRRQLLVLGLAGLAVSACKTQSGYSAVFDEPPRPPTSSPTPAATPTSRQSPRVAVATLNRAVSSPIPASQPAAMPMIRPLVGTEERVLVRSSDAGAPLVGIDVATSATAYTIPADLATPDGLHWIGLHPTAGNTSVTLYAAKDGSPVRTFSAPGRYSQGAVSHDSRRLLLVAPPAASDPHPLSELALVDLTNGATL